MKESSHSRQPKYYTLVPKRQARVEIVHVWKHFTGLDAIPEDKNYWTLCNYQPDIDGAEIVELVRMGLLVPSQFNGVDRDAAIIEHNQNAHPQASWFHGDLLEVVDEHYDRFKPALVHYDSTRTVTTESARTYLAALMNFCPPGTVIAANLMLSTGHDSRRFDPTPFVEGLTRHQWVPNEWSFLEEYYTYKGSYTQMGTLFFHRRER